MPVQIIARATVAVTTPTVQAMVFGNADARSGSGVAFTRNPNNGENSLYGEYLIGRQGEDLVSGTHTPIDLSDPQRETERHLGGDSAPHSTNELGVLLREFDELR